MGKAPGAGAEATPQPCAKAINPLHITLPACEHHPRPSTYLLAAFRDAISRFRESQSFCTVATPAPLPIDPVCDVAPPPRWLTSNQDKRRSNRRLGRLSAGAPIRNHRFIDDFLELPMLTSLSVPRLSRSPQGRPEQPVLIRQSGHSTCRSILARLVSV